MNNPLCECGCGEPVSKPSNRYINGHNYRGKVGQFKGKKHTEETRKKMSESHIGLQAGENSPFYGKKLNKSHRKNISKALKGKYTGPLNSMYGKHHSQETKDKMRISSSGERAWNWKGDEAFERYCPIFKNKDFRQIIYQRDSNTCQLCGCTRQLNFKLTGHKRLTIHHIDHNKKNCDLRNCILVCVRCNSMVEGRKVKEHYEKYLTGLVTYK